MARSETELDALEASAQAWVGTPWADNSAAIGRGVCCHLLLARVYHAAGWLPALEMPTGSSMHARGNDRPIMLEWFRGLGSEWFLEVDAHEPGDALLLHVGHVPHHLGLSLRGGRVLHVTCRQGVRIVESGGQWERLLANTFRPKS